MRFAQTKSEVPKYGASRREAHISSAIEDTPEMKTSAIKGSPAVRASVVGAGWTVSGISDGAAAGPAAWGSRSPRELGLSRMYVYSLRRPTAKGIESSVALARSIAWSQMRRCCPRRARRSRRAYRCALSHKSAHVPAMSRYQVKRRHSATWHRRSEPSDSGQEAAGTGPGTARHT